MSPTIPLRAAALVLCLSTAHSYASAQASAPHLRHTTPPFVGQVLTLDVEAAVPLSPIELYFSPQAGSTTTSYGVLELQHSTLQLLASGTTTASGTWSFDLPIPLQQSLAETGAHFQALVDDSSAPAGRVFSDAVHARFLGPRVYAGYRSLGAGMYIVSAVTEAVVARVDYLATGSWNAYRHEGKPVFDTACTRGAVMSTQNELLFFDPFLGGVQGRISFASNCSGTVFTDAARRTVYVLELAGGSAPARIHAIDLATGSETAQLDLPNAVEAIWCAGRAGSEVFVAEHEPGGRTAIRWVGLGPLVDRGSTPVGTPVSSSFTAYNGTSDVPLPIVYSTGQLFVSTYGWSGMSALGSLSRCLTSASGIGARVTNLGTTIMWALAPVPAADRLLGGQMRTDWGPAGWMCQVPLRTVGPPTGLAWPPTGPEMYVHDIEADGKVAWIIAEWEWQHNDILYRLDLETMTWTVTPYSWLSGRNDAEVLRDAWNHEVWISNERQLGWLPAGIRVVDELHGTSRHIRLDRAPEVLHAVPLP